MIDLELLIERFDENRIRYELCDLGGGWSILISGYGGRIFGPFKNGDESICWINPVVENETVFSRFIADRIWNIGGDRVWLEPELQYNVADPRDFWGSYSVPDELDPGHYSIHKTTGESVMLSQHMNLSVYGSAGGKKKLKMERNIYPAANPLPDLDLGFCGYHHEIFLEEPERDGVVSGVWNLLQVRPQGVIHIPTTVKADFADYYDPVPDDYQMITDDSIRLKIDARCKFKLGYSSMDTIGRSAYLSSCQDGPYLLIRLYDNTAAGNYPPEDLKKKPDSGISLRVYNDSGDMGDFAEHECSCLPLGADAPYRQSHRETITNLFFFGGLEELGKAGKRFLGIELAGFENFLRNNLTR